MLNNPINASDPSGHKCVGEPEECLNEKGKPINGSGGLSGGNQGGGGGDAGDLHDRHKPLSIRFQITREMDSGASVNLPAYYGDYDQDMNIPYIPGVSSGIRGLSPMAQNPCRGVGGVGCGISVFNDLLLFFAPQQNNRNSNFSLTFNVEYRKSFEIRSIIISGMQYANRGQNSLLTKVQVGNEILHTDNVYMPTDGSYQPTQQNGGYFDGSDDLAVNVNISVITNTPNGPGSVPRSRTWILPAVP